jgi:hypothetical protein
MRKRIKYLLGSLLVMIHAMPAGAKIFDKVDSYGIYVVAEKGYVKVESYIHNYRFVDFNYLNEVPFVTRASQSLKLIIYEKDFNPKSIELELRPLDTKVTIHQLDFTIKKMDDPDKYELTVDTKVSDGAMLQVRCWSFFENMGVVMLGETQGELIKYFSQKQLKFAPVVAQYAEDTTHAFPKNKPLKELNDYWQAAAKSEKDTKDYAYVEEKWLRYEQAEKLTLKEQYLNAVLLEINGYLITHPNGSKTEEAKQRKTIAEEKLKEYKKTL